MAKQAKKTTATKKPDPKAKLPPALAKNAAAAQVVREQRLLEEAKAAIALVLRKKAAVAEAFYEMGEALAVLKRREIVVALGRATFEEICKRDLAMSHTLANQLIEVAARYTREQAIALGQSKAIALLDLVAATPEDDTPEELLAGMVRLPDGGKVVPKTATANELTRAAKAVRRATAAALMKTVKGRTVGPDDQALAHRIADALDALPQVKVRPVAGLPGKPATFRFEGITAETLAAFVKALARVK